MPKSGEHKVNYIDSFFRQRPSINSVREGETISFLEDGKLIKQEKRNGVVYQSEFAEAIPKLSTDEVETGVIREIIAGDGLTGGGFAGEITLNVVGGTGITANANDIAIDSTVATLTGSQTLTNKSIDLDSNTLTGTLTEFNTALQGDSFVSLTGTETLTNKTLTAPTFTGTAQGANLTLTGDLTVQGDTTTLNTATLQVEDKNIVLNYHASNDTSSSAEGAGITIQDAVDASTDATILWDQVPGEFDFSHAINVTGNISVSGTVDGVDIAARDHDAVTLANTNYLSISGQEITGGTVPVGSGGTGATSLTDNSVLTGTGTSAITAEANLTFDGSTLNVNGDIKVGVGADAQLTSVNNGLAIRNLVSNADMFFYVNDGGVDTEAMRIDGATANVGIGETSIDANLHISGSPVVLKMDRVGTRAMRMGVPDNSSDFVFADSDDLKSNQRLELTGAGDVYVVNNLGVGTASPAGKLEIKHTSATISDPHIAFEGSGGEADDFAIYAPSGENTLRFGYSGSGEDTDILTIQRDSATSGSVGIGTNSPGNTLQVSGSGSTPMSSERTTNSGGFAMLQGKMGDSASTTAGHVYSALVAGIEDNTNGAEDGYFAVEVSEGGSGSEKLRIKSNGNVGIGVTNPSRKLQVAGAIELSTADTTIDTNNFALRRGASGEGFLDAPGNIQMNIDTNNNQSDAYFAVCRDAGSTPLFKVLESGAITFNNAYTFPTADGSTGQFLKTNGSGSVQFSDGDIDYTDLGSGSLGLNDNNKTLIFNSSSASWSVDFPATTLFTANTNVDNRILTATGATNGVAVNGEANLTFDGTNLDIAADDSKLRLGAGNDGQIYVSSDNLIIRNVTADKDVILQSDDGSGGETAYITLDGSATKVQIDKNMVFSDNVQAQFGGNVDLKIYHNSSSSNNNIENYSGSLYVTNYVDDADIIFRTEDGSGGVTTYIELDGSTERVDIKKPLNVEDGGRFIDSSILYFGDNNDLRIQHNGSNSFIQQYGTGNLYIDQTIDDKDIIFRNDDGSGGTTAYLTLDGSAGFTKANKEIKFLDSVQALFGDSSDMVIWHDGSHNRIQGANGDMYISNYADDKDVILQSDDGSGGVTPYLTLDGSATSIEISKKMQFPASHSADKIVMYSGGNEKIGTEANTLLFTADNYKFKDTNGDVNLFMNNSGNVGIGTSSPLEKLHIYEIGNSAYKTYTSAGAGVLITSYQSQGNPYTKTTDIVANSDGTVPSEMRLFTKANGASSASERLRIDSSGNVGIGNTSPDATFHIGDNSSSFTLGTTSGDSIDLLKLETDSTNANQLIFSSERVSDGSTWTSTRERIRRRVDTSNMGYIQFGSSFDATNAHMISFGEVGVGDYMGITGDGKIGIGTTSPSEKLHVSDSIKADTSLLIGSNSNFLTTQLKVGDGTRDIRLNANHSSNAVVGTVGSHDFNIMTANTFRMTIDDSGSVGIGNTSPDATFHVGDNSSSFTLGTTSGDSIDLLKLETDSTNANQLIFSSERVSDGSTWTSTRERIRRRVDTSNMGYIQFGSSFDATNAHMISFGEVGVGDYMGITGDGKIGIGTTSPSEKLHVSDSIKADTSLLIGSNSNFLTTQLKVGDGTRDIRLNANHSSNAVVGTVGSHDFNLMTANTFRMTIDDSGNVGIGTTSPSKKLHIKDSTNEIVFIESSDDNADIVGADTGGSTRFRSASGIFQFFTGGSASNASASGSSFAMEIDENQRVGIGTSSPTYELDVAGDIGVDHVIYHNGDTNTYHQFTTDRQRFFAGGELLLDLYEDGTQDYVKLGDGGDVDINLNDDMFVEGSSGNVGIGTTSPGALLTVYKDGTQASSVSTTYQIQTVSNSNGGIAIQAGDSSHGYLVFGDNGNYDAGRIAYGNSSGAMGFWTADNERMRINSTGLGIGTTSPQGHLDINTESAEATKVVINGEVSQDKLLLIRHLENSELSTTNALGFIGSVVDNVLTLGHYNSSGSEVQVLHITEGADVGIGTTSPTYKLDVESSDTYIAHFVSTGTNAFMQLTTTTHGVTTGDGLIWGIDSNADTYFTNRENASMRFSTNNTEAFRIDNSQDAHFDQDVIAFSTTPSDIRLKENFEKIENGLDVVSQLEGHTFNWKKGGERLSAGFKAQEVEKILPHLVDEKKLPLRADDDKEYKILRYEEMIPYLVEAIKEQQEQINELKEKLNG